MDPGAKAGGNPGWGPPQGREGEWLEGTSPNHSSLEATAAGAATFKKESGNPPDILPPSGSRPSLGAGGAPGRGLVGRVDGGGAPSREPSWGGVGVPEGDPGPQLGEGWPPRTRGRGCARRARHRSGFPVCRDQDDFFCPPSELRTTGVGHGTVALRGALDSKYRCTFSTYSSPKSFTKRYLTEPRG